MTITRLRMVTALLFSVALGAATASARPFHVYLTWQGDTSTTMTLNIHTPKSQKKISVYYDTQSRGGNAGAYAHSAPCAAHQIEGLSDKRRIHVAELTGLDPGATYFFIAGDEKKGYSKEQKFRTVPSDATEISFVTGGDMHVTPTTRKLLALAGKEDPMFCVVGGDIAYVNGVLKEYRRWDTWLDNWENNMVTTDGHMIPMVLAVGNHEVTGYYDRSIEFAPFYTGYFAQAPGLTYFTRRFGADTVLFILDSGHATPHGGVQKEWLAGELEKYQDLRYRFAVYHVPLYPSYRHFEGRWSMEGRKHWLGLFDKYHLTTAFENHDHTQKRTKRLKGGKVDPEGTLYLGDGCFGILPRELEPDRKWYEETASSTAHFWSVKVTPSGVTFEAIDKEGHVFDSTRLP